MISEDILPTIFAGLFWVLVAVLVYALLRWAGRAVARKRARLVGWPPGWRDKDRNEPDNCGDQGGLPAGAWDRSATLRPWKAGD